MRRACSSASSRLRRRRARGRAADTGPRSPSASSISGRSASVHGAFDTSGARSRRRRRCSDVESRSAAAERTRASNPNSSLTSSGPVSTGHMRSRTARTSGSRRTRAVSSCSHSGGGRSPRASAAATATSSPSCTSRPGNRGRSASSRSRERRYSATSARWYSRRKCSITRPTKYGRRSLCVPRRARVRSEMRADSRRRNTTR